jgi:lipoprotein-releasing system ATP-binding protein
MAEPLVAIRNLTKTFMHMGRELHVLRGIDLDIHHGEVVAIVGKSGAGKSTLLHCMGTLDLPTKGTIRLGPYDIVGLNGARLAAIRNEMIGFVFQFHHLLPEFNALENVMMPGLIQGRSRSQMIPAATALLAEVGLAHRTTHRPGELSGGEQQRVALARALVLEPKLILADEPTGNLDTGTSDAIHALFFALNQKHGTSIVVVTHNVAFAQSMPRVVTMEDGKIFSDQRIEPVGPPSSSIGAIAPAPSSQPGSGGAAAHDDGAAPAEDGLGAPPSAPEAAAEDAGV